VCVGLNIAAVDYNLIVILCVLNLFLEENRETRRKSRKKKELNQY